MRSSITEQKPVNPKKTTASAESHQKLADELVKEKDCVKEKNAARLVKG